MKTIVEYKMIKSDIDNQQKIDLFNQECNSLIAQGFVPINKLLVDHFRATSFETSKQSFVIKEFVKYKNII